MQELLIITNTDVKQNWAAIRCTPKNIPMKSNEEVGVALKGGRQTCEVRGRRNTITAKHCDPRRKVPLGP